jgi:ABC-type transport system involved in multi-copper enzyme maturation permease subunit
MTAATASHPFDAPERSRLTNVELRKMVDTRAGLWLLLCIAGLTVATALLSAVLGHDSDHTLRLILGNAVQPAVVFLPVLGVLLVASEWSQRTALITFTLVPQRGRVLWAKIVAGIVISLIALVFALVVSLIATAIASPGVEHTWSLPFPLLRQMAVYVITSTLIGIGFGAVLLSSAPAIVLNFVLPLAWGAIASIHAIEPTARWLDQTRSLSPLTEHVMHGTEWARAGTTLLLWMVIPLLVGAWRIARSEIG